MNIKEYFEKKCRNLGSFDSVDSEFGISEIEEGNFARKIAEKIVEKIGKYRKLFEDFLHADGSNVAVLMEIKDMNDKDKELLNQLYKELMIIERELLLAELESNEKRFLTFVKNSIDTWHRLRPDIESILKKARESWNKNMDIKDEIKYLG